MTKPSIDIGANEPTRLGPNGASPSFAQTLGSKSALARMLLACCITGSGIPGIAVAQVGMTVLQTDSSSVTVIYPTQEAAKTVVRGPFSIEVAVDAKPLEGNRRLVVMSHGTGGSAIVDHQLAAKLARAGFVVAQPSHRGDNSRDRSMVGPESWKLRPAEVMRAVDLVSGSSTFGHLVDPRRFGVHGMSAGGVSALALAGGRWSIQALAKHCTANEQADFGFCALGTQDQASQQARSSLLTDLAARDPATLPPHVLQEHGDEAHREATGSGANSRRLSSVTVMVPVAAVFTAQSLASISVPVGVVTAGKDTLLVPEFHSTKLLRECANCKQISNLAEAAHFDVLSPWPSVIATAVAASYPRGGGLSPTFNPEDRLAAFDSIVRFHTRNLVDHESPATPR